MHFCWILISIFLTSTSSFLLFFVFLSPSTATDSLDSTYHTTSLIELEGPYQIAKLITVKVQANQNKGSGILIQKYGNIYRVLTNAHVLTSGEPFQVQLFDGVSYTAYELKSVNWQGYDLAILEFRASKSYSLAVLGNSSKLTMNKSVFAAGFSSNSKELDFTSGKIMLITAKKIEGGYQIGYTNSIEQGMSGGPILSENGEVVGVNGMGAYPILNTAYRFEDGSFPKEAQLSLMRQFSWGIPINTVTQIGYKNYFFRKFNSK